MNKGRYSVLLFIYNIENDLCNEGRKKIVSRYLTLVDMKMNVGDEQG